MSTTGLRELRQEDLYAELEELLVPWLARVAGQREPGHCMRVGDLDTSLAIRLCRRTRRCVPAAQVYVLRSGSEGADDVSVTSTKLVELRNPETDGSARPPLLVFVPAGTKASAEDSFGLATFEELDLGDVYTELCEALRAELPAQLRSAVDELFGLITEAQWPHADELARTRYLLTLKLNDFDNTAAGAALFELGLIPDFGLFTDLSQVLRRAACNIHHARSMATPTRPERGRVIDLGLTDPAYTARLAEFAVRAGLEDPKAWTRRIVVDRENWGLAFQHWPLPEELTHERVRVDVGELPLRRAGENPGDHDDQIRSTIIGQQYLPTGAQGTNQLAVSFQVSPAPRQVAGLSRFIVALISEDSGPTGVVTSVRVGTKSKTEYKATLKKLKKSQLENGWHFIRVSGVDTEGVPYPMETAGESGAPPHESQRFFVIADGDAEEPAEPRVRREEGLTQAKLRLSFDVLADGRAPTGITCTATGWKNGPESNVVRAVFAGEAIVDIRLAARLREIERAILTESAEAAARRLTTAGTLLHEPGVSQADDEVWRKFLVARRNLFEQISGTDQLVVEGRDLADMAELALDYGRAYQALVAHRLQQTEEGRIARACLAAVLAIDTVVVELPGEGMDAGEEVAIVSPTHPLRLLWLVTWTKLGWSWLNSELPASGAALRSAKSALFDDLAPLGFPLAVPRADGRLLMAADDLNPYWGALAATDSPDPQGTLRALTSVLGKSAQSSSRPPVSGQALADRVERYLRAHPYVTTLTIAAVNPGRAEALADMLVQLQRRAEFSDLRYDLRLFFRDPDVPDAGGALVELLHGEWNTAHEVERFREPSAGLTPKLSVSLRPLEEFSSASTEHTVHLTILFDAFGGETFEVGTGAERHHVTVHGLAQEMRSHYQVAEEIASWRKVPVHGSAHPLPGSSEFSDLMGQLPGLMSTAAATVSSGQVSRQFVPCVTLNLDAADRTLLHQAHRSSDWVITIDRTMGMELFDSPSSAQRSEYVIDHSAPDTSTLGHHIVVSSRSVDELRALLLPAMSQHDVNIEARHVGTFFDQLRQLSGRLAFKIASAAPNQRTEILGLALARLYLAYQGVLANQLLVPLDAHLELYRDARAQSSEFAVRLDRTDLALFDLDAEQRVITCSLVEVKCASSVPDLAAYQRLKDRITEQLNRSAEVLAEHFDPRHRRPDRPDRVVKNAEFSAMLRFYLDRAQRHEIIGESATREASWLLDRLDEGYRMEFTRTGLIFDLAGTDTGVELEGGIEFHRVGRQLIDELIEHIPTDPVLARQGGEEGTSADVRSIELTTPRLEDAAFLRPARERSTRDEDEMLDDSPIELSPEEGMPNAAEEDQEAASPVSDVEEQHFGDEGQQLVSQPDIITGTDKGTPQYGVIGEVAGRKVGIDLNETHTISLFGVQGGGKSYTLGSLIEMASLSAPPVNQLPQPLATIVFHYSKTKDYPPEFTSMTAANDDLGQIEQLRERYGVAPRALEDVVLLTPEDQVDARRREHPNVQVLPLKFGSSELRVDHWKFLMGAVGNQANYIRQVQQILRKNRSNLTLGKILDDVDQSGMQDHLKRLVQDRLNFASEYIDDSVRIKEIVQPGRMIIVDLRDELISKDEALGLFVVLMEIFAEAQSGESRFNKLVVLDEAHKYIDSPELVSGLVESVREMRHKGMSVLVASQDPLSVPAQLISLSDHIILHKLNSPAWLKHIQRANDPLSSLTMTKMANLRPGEAYVWANKATDSAVMNGAVKIDCRPRLTKHGGATKTAVDP
ncbi:methylation-associated defense system ATP-binding protein MAD8 [Haloactinomyces albus]|uniref:ATP-binding protein n=1 Tax=Haloactinomyces albus TaxID=1352928 RepID=A0AAE3ZH57_9ACTN|nr:hypothetical protein [Haloactinomyces albus]MDR7303499.1 hypothetical protein [Haloactinomyces albus]